MSRCLREENQKMQGGRFVLPAAHTADFSEQFVYIFFAPESNNVSEDYPVEVFIPAMKVKGILSS